MHTGAQHLHIPEKLCVLQNQAVQILGLMGKSGLEEDHSKSMQICNQNANKNSSLYIGDHLYSSKRHLSVAGGRHNG